METAKDLGRHYGAPWRSGVRGLGRDALSYALMWSSRGPADHAPEPGHGRPMPSARRGAVNQALSSRNTRGCAK